MAVLATALGALAGVLWAQFFRCLINGEVPHRYRVVRRVEKPRDFWKRMRILGSAASLATLALVMTVVLKSQRP